MKNLSKFIKLIPFFKLVEPKRKMKRHMTRRKRRLRMLNLLNPKHSGKIAYHIGKIKFRNDLKKLV